MKEKLSSSLSELAIWMTAKAAEPEALPEVAEIVAVPTATAIATPELLTVATDVLLLLQLTEAPAIVLPYWSLTEAKNWVVAPIADWVADAGDTETEVATAVGGGGSVVDPPPPSPQPATNGRMIRWASANSRVQERSWRNIFIS